MGILKNRAKGLARSLGVLQAIFLLMERLKPPQGLTKHILIFQREYLKVGTRRLLLDSLVLQMIRTRVFGPAVLGIGVSVLVLKRDISLRNLNVRIGVRLSLLGKGLLAKCRSWDVLGIEGHFRYLI